MILEKRIEYQLSHILNRPTEISDIICNIIRLSIYIWILFCFLENTEYSTRHPFLSIYQVQYKESKSYFKYSMLFLLSEYQMYFQNSDCKGDRQVTVTLFKIMNSENILAKI